MAAFDGTPLDDLSEIPKQLVKKLKASWITTAEQLVAAAAAMGGAEAMAGHLGMGAAEFRRALAAAEAALPASERTRLKSPADTRDRGLGALQ